MHESVNGASVAGKIRSTWSVDESATQKDPVCPSSAVAATLESTALSSDPKQFDAHRVTNSKRQGLKRDWETQTQRATTIAPALATVKGNLSRRLS